MTRFDIARHRLLNQRISAAPLRKPSEVVGWLSAVQAQDYASAKWALGLRMQSATDMLQIVYELHTLLEKGGAKPALVLVGHSYGGWLVRLYASTYPADVTAMVLVEAGADNPRRMLPDGKLVRSADLATGRPIPAVKVSNPLRVSDILHFLDAQDHRQLLSHAALVQA